MGPALARNLYARLHPAEVRAAILLEAAAPKDLTVLPAHETGVQRLLKLVMERLVPGDPNAETKQTAAHQERLVRLSPLGNHLVAAGSGHFPQFSEPTLVIAAVEEAIRSSR